VRRVIEHADPQAFGHLALPVLLAAEAENCVQIGLAHRMAAGGYAPESVDGLDRPLLLTVEGDGGIDLIAVQTLRRTMIVSRGSTAGVQCLADWLAARPWEGAWIVGVCPSVGELARAYGEASGRVARVGMRQRTFQASAVVPPRAVPGTMRPATPADRGTLAAFMHGFEVELAMVDDEDPLARADRSIAAGRLFVWEDGGGPVAMAGWAGPTPHGVRVNWVYTPPDRRGRGYASNLVAALTRRLLAGGRRFCFLHTDLANPISNGIYQRLGYQPVCDGERWTFG